MSRTIIPIGMLIGAVLGSLIGGARSVEEVIINVLYVVPLYLLGRFVYDTIRQKRLLRHSLPASLEVDSKTFHFRYRTGTNWRGNTYFVWVDEGQPFTMIITDDPQSSVMVDFPGFDETLIPATINLQDLVLNTNLYKEVIPDSLLQITVYIGMIETVIDEQEFRGALFWADVTPKGRKRRRRWKRPEISIPLLLPDFQPSQA